MTGQMLIFSSTSNLKVLQEKLLPADRINQDDADWKPTSGKMRVLHNET
jgi:hypothetical protein